MRRSNRCADPHASAESRATICRRFAARAAADDGSASLEFITAGMLLLIPLVYLIVALATIQSAALATEGAARHAARVFVQAPDTAAGSIAAARALELALADHGVAAEVVDLTISCRPNPASCHTRRGWVTVEVSARVPLPLVPDALDLRTPLAMPIDASATQQVSRFWGTR